MFVGVLGKDGGALCFTLISGEERRILKLKPQPVVVANAGRRVVGFGVGEDGGEFGPELFGDVVSRAEHGRADSD